MTDFGRILVIHVEEMDHHRLDGGLAGIIRLHGHDAAENLERSAIPIFENIVMRGDPCVDQSAEVFADRLASMPICDAKVSNGVFGKQ